MNQIVDPFNRKITYLRVSVTDHCNYRCHYCRDEDHQTHTKKSQVLSFEEIARIVRLFAELGVTKVRLTGGEPLLRKDILDLNPINEKWKSFNWDVLEIDGHNYFDIYNSLIMPSKKPRIIIANTIKGKGFSFSENNNAWHHKILTNNQYQEALIELDK